MSETADFLASTMPRQVEAETAIHNGDPNPRLAMWSQHDPVTLFGASVSKSGWEDVSSTFRWLASRFADCSAYEVELRTRPYLTVPPGLRTLDGSDAAGVNVGDQDRPGADLPEIVHDPVRVRSSDH